MRNKLGLFVLILSFVSIIIGIYIYTLPEKKVYIPPVDEKVITETEAEGITNDLITRALKLYESPYTIFSTTAYNDERLKINNYDAVTNTIFSTNGKKELENVKFNNKNFIDKTDTDIYILSSIPEDKKYSSWQITTKKYFLSKSYFTLTLTFVNSTMEEDQIPKMSSVSTDIKMIKENDRWLIDKFDYNEL